MHPLLPPLLADGFVVVPDVLDAATLARLREAFSPTPTSGTQHVRVTPETPGYPAWAALPEHPILRTAAEALLGREFHVGDLHGRNPLPGFGQQGLHADWPARTAPNVCHVVTALWMLDDFTVENGATRVVPGSHRLPGAVPRALAQPLAHHPDERVVTGRAGSVLLLDGHLWHSGRWNTSEAGRRCVQMVVRRGKA
jgi:ectoine hydroxylase-related dioxygenase (phytanoyl-CoA dioxygenase family)